MFILPEHGPVKGHIMKPQKVDNGFYIYTKVRVPKDKIPLIGKNQLVKSGVVPFLACPDLNTAKRIQIDWTMELKGRANRSLTYKDYVSLYKNHTGNHADTSIVDRLEKELGNYSVDTTLTIAFEKFISIVSGEKVKRWKSVGGNLILCDTEKDISPSTIQAYKRYHKAICNFATSENCSIECRINPDKINTGLIKVGKTEKRKRHIEEWERNKYIEIAGNDYPWFLHVVDFARSMPIRPEDQIQLLTGRVATNWHVPYLPSKTAKTGKIARPRIMPHLRDFVNARRKDSTCLFLFCRTGFKRNGENPDKNYQISYWTIDSVHGTICRRAGIKNLRFYDWRHDAVNYLLSIGFTVPQIMTFAGWSSDEMVYGYDTEDPNRLSAVCEMIENEAAEKMKGIVIPFNRTGS